MKSRIAIIAIIAVVALAWPALALADDIALSQADVGAILGLVHDRKWAALGGLCIFGMVRFIKSDIRPAWLNVPARARIWVVWALNVAGLVVDKVAEGVPWRTAAANMLVSVVVSVVVLQETWIASIRGGKELPVPGLTIPGARPSPTAPATVTPPDPPPVVVPGTGDADALARAVEAQPKGPGGG